MGNNYKKLIPARYERNISNDTAVSYDNKIRLKECKRDPSQQVGVVLS